jgi:hypothetical protein
VRKRRARAAGIGDEPPLVAAADYARLVVLAAFRGAPFLSMRVAAPVPGPVVTADARAPLAGTVLVTGG